MYGLRLEDDSSSESDAEPEENVLEKITAAVRAEVRPASVERFRVVLGMVRC